MSTFQLEPVWKSTNGTREKARLDRSWTAARDKAQAALDEFNVITLDGRDYQWNGEQWITNPWMFNGIPVWSGATSTWVDVLLDGES